MCAGGHALDTLVMAPAPPCAAIAHFPSGFGDVVVFLGTSRDPNFGGLLGVAAFAPVIVAMTDRALSREKVAPHCR